MTRLWLGLSWIVHLYTDLDGECRRWVQNTAVDRKARRGEGVCALTVHVGIGFCHFNLGFTIITTSLRPKVDECYTPPFDFYSLNSLSLFRFLLFLQIRMSFFCFFKVRMSCIYIDYTLDISKRVTSTTCLDTFYYLIWQLIWHIN